MALVTMPFASARRPSIQCGLLAAVLREAGHEVEVRYLNLELAARLGAPTYTQLSDYRRNDALLGEWLFAVAAFGDEVEVDDDAYWADVRGADALPAAVGLDRTVLQVMRQKRFPELVDEWADELEWDRFDVVGFSSTFEQTTASLALAARLKARHPDLVTVLGGANADGEMGPELARTCEQLDYVVVGEGERALVELVDAVVEGRSALGVPGVVGRSDGSVVSGGRGSTTQDLDELPIPDYRDYFAAVERLGGAAAVSTSGLMVPFESARGCWWGQKHHCTFCGLNGDAMRFRSKSPERVLDELRHLASAYRVLELEAVDNILDLRYLPRVLRPLAAEGLDYSLFYEVKATLTRAQVELLADAGVTRIQPGIESLSTHVLSLMRKGTTMLANVRLLKWATYHGIGVGWNLIMGFPGERLEDYDAQLDLLPRIAHLQPPGGAGPIWLERFSPYFDDPELGLRVRGPKPAYRHVFPDRVALDRVAYFFDYEAPADGLPESLFRHLAGEVERWKARWQAGPPQLVHLRGPDWLELLDTRAEGPPVTLGLHGTAARAYLACEDRERTPTQVVEALAADPGGGDGADPPDEATVRRILDECCRRGLMITEDDRYLALALPAHPGRRVARDA